MVRMVYTRGTNSPSYE